HEPATGALASFANASPPEVRPAHGGRSLTIEQLMTMGAKAGTREETMRRAWVHGLVHGATSHPGVCGLRARLKPERFWFDSRGWDERVDERAPCADVGP